MHFRKAVSAAETVPKRHTASASQLACHCMGNMDVGMDMVGRANTAMGATRHRQCSQTPGGGMRFPMVQGVGAGTLPQLSESQLAFHPELFLVRCLSTST